MNCDLETLERSVAWSDAYGILAALLSYQCLRDVCEAIKVGSLQEDIRAVSSELDFDREAIGSCLAEFDGMREEMQRGACGYHDVRYAYTSLFNHPDDPLVPLFEGMFINRRRALKSEGLADGDVLFVNRAALDAARQYRRAGMVRRKMHNVPEDSAILELEFMQKLHRMRAEAILSGDEDRLVEVGVWVCEFRKIHLDKWMSDFFAACELKSPVKLYRAVGILGREVVRSMAEL